MTFPKTGFVAACFVTLSNLSLLMPCKKGFTVQCSSFSFALRQVSAYHKQYLLSPSPSRWRATVRNGTRRRCSSSSHRCNSAWSVEACPRYCCGCRKICLPGFGLTTPLQDRAAWRVEEAEGLARAGHLAAFDRVESTESGITESKPGHFRKLEVHTLWESLRQLGGRGSLATKGWGTPIWGGLQSAD